jgi:hypothetical protein
MNVNQGERNLEARTAKEIMVLKHPASFAQTFVPLISPFLDFPFALNRVDRQSPADPVRGTFYPPPVWG